MTFQFHQYSFNPIQFWSNPFQSPLMTSWKACAFSLNSRIRYPWQPCRQTSKSDPNLSLGELLAPAGICTQSRQQDIISLCWKLEYFLLEKHSGRILLFSGGRGLNLNLFFSLFVFTFSLTLSLFLSLFRALFLCYSCVIRSNLL